MKIVLLTDIKKIGECGDVCEIEDGYAMNFLIPRKKAIDANAMEGKQAVQKRALGSMKRGEKKETDQNNFASLPKTITFSVSSNEQGTIFNAITPEVLVQELKKNTDVNASPEWFSFTPIKSVGEHKIIATHGGEKREIIAILV